MFAVGNTTKKRAIPRAESPRARNGKTFPRISLVRFARSAKTNFPRSNNSVFCIDLFRKSAFVPRPCFCFGSNSVSSVLSSKKGAHCRFDEKFVRLWRRAFRTAVTVFYFRIKSGKKDKPLFCMVRGVFFVRFCRILNSGRV